MLFRSATAALVASAALALFVQTATAEEPVETAIRGWVASIDASPDWQATYRSLAYDAAANRAVLAGLDIRSQTPGVEIGFGTIALTGFIATPEGGFTASRVTADEGTLQAGPFKVAVSDGEVNGFAMPALPALTWDPQHPFTSFIKAYAPLSRLTMTNGRIGSLGLIETNAGVASRIGYEQFRIDRWTGGKIAAITAGPLSMESPSQDGLLAMKVASFEAHDLDIDAMLGVFDPDRYANGIGDGVWRKVTGLTAYHDFAIAGPGMKVTMSLLSLEDFRLRQPRHSFAGYLDGIFADPNAPTDDPQMAQAIVDMVSAYSLGRLGMSGLDIAAEGMKTFHLGGFNVSDLSAERLGEFAIDDLATEVTDVGAFKLGHFAIGNVVLPGAGGLLQAILASQGNANPDVTGLAPKPGFIEISGLDLAAVDAPRVKLDRMRVDLADYVGAVPTTVAADLGSLVLPVSVLDANAQAVFEKLGYDTLDLGYRLKAKWNEADETLAVDDLQFDLKGAGGLTMAMLLGGLPRGDREAGDSLRRAAAACAQPRDADAQGRFDRRQGPRPAGREDARQARDVPSAVRRRHAAAAVAVRAERPEAGGVGEQDPDSRQAGAGGESVHRRAGIVDHRRAQAAEAGRLPDDLGCCRQRAGLADHPARPQRFRFGDTAAGRRRCQAAGEPDRAGPVAGSAATPAGSGGCEARGAAGRSRWTARPSSGPRRAGSSGTASPRADCPRRRAA